MIDEDVRRCLAQVFRGTTGGAATPDIAEYALAVAASQIILLVDLANSQEDDIPI